MKESRNPPGLVILEVLFAIKEDDSFCFHESIGTVSPLYVELWTIFTGLQFAWNKDIPSLIIQWESMDALKLNREPTTSRNSISLVRAIITMVMKNWSVHFH
ncbi:hypothetical protein V6N13_049111 [Hibiscus sabdariffa]